MIYNNGHTLISIYLFSTKKHSYVLFFTVNINFFYDLNEIIIKFELIISPQEFKNLTFNDKMYLKANLFNQFSEASSSSL
jgi:hypothetical protein